ncbi:MAG: helix-turn-helix domain-containing protein [Candidatus Bathyarchaeia archaeon]
MRENGLASPSDEQKVLMGKIAGAIVLSEEPGSLMRLWREKFSISLTQLAKELEISPSVISDYENGRRKNPGIQFIKRFVFALFEINKKDGIDLTHELLGLTDFSKDGILHIEEFSVPVGIKRFSRAISGQIITYNESKNVSGYTIIDSETVITKLPRWKLPQIFGKTLQRALIFTNIKHERTPMLALRFSLLKPAVIVYHIFQPEKMDIQLAENDGVILIHSKAKSFENLLRALRKLRMSLLKEKNGKIRK